MTDTEHAKHIYIISDPESPCNVEDNYQPTCSESASAYEEFVNLLDCPSPQASEKGEISDNEPLPNNCN